MSDPFKVYEQQTQVNRKRMRREHRLVVGKHPVITTKNRTRRVLAQIDTNTRSNNGTLKNPVSGCRRNAECIPVQSNALTVSDNSTPSKFVTMRNNEKYDLLNRILAMLSMLQIVDADLKTCKQVATSYFEWFKYHRFLYVLERHHRNPISTTSTNSEFPLSILHYPINITVPTHKVIRIKIIGCFMYVCHVVDLTTTNTSVVLLAVSYTQTLQPDDKLVLQDNMAIQITVDDQELPLYLKWKFLKHN
jgi:hypothetical protein